MSFLRPPLFRGAGGMSHSLLLHFILRPPLFRGAGGMSLPLFCCTLFYDLPSSEGPGVCRSLSSVALYLATSPLQRGRGYVALSSVALYFTTSPLQRGRGYVALSLLLHFILRPPLFRGAGGMSLSLFCCTLFCDLPSSEGPGVCRSLSSVALYRGDNPESVNMIHIFLVHN